MLARFSVPLRTLILAGWLLAATSAHAANEPRPVVGPGATKDEVIAAYGWPNGQSQSGGKEILRYNQGDVILEDGKVERVNFSPDVPWQAPRPRPAPPTASTRKVPEAPVNFWLTDFEAARSEAIRRHARILVLFTGSDWSPASRQFAEDVEFHPDFVNAFIGDLVFLKLDYPRGNPVPVKISDELLRLRDRYQVTTYPTLLVINPTGEEVARADLTRSPAGLSFRDRVIEAVREARASVPPLDPRREPEPPEAGAVTPPAAGDPPAADSTAPAPAAAAPAGSSTEPLSPAAPAISNAGRLVMAALLVGGGLVLFFLWRLWRQPRVPHSGEGVEFTERIEAAADGLPSAAEMAGWSKERLVSVVAALAEFDDYKSRARPAGDDVDLELRRRDDVAPRILVVCSAQGAPVSTKRLREFFATLTAEGVAVGWYVSPRGFAPDANAYAEAHGLSLLNAEGLHNLMRDVPPVSLPRVLAGLKGS